jgi:hypothetical protein
MATGNEMTLRSFLTLANSLSSPTHLTLALNVKSDGLALPLKKALEAYSHLDCFVFDMSIPDMRSYFNTGIPVFTRMSEVEKEPIWLERSDGIWLDSFESEWFDTSIIERLLQKGKRVCIVSPELHHRDHLLLWHTIKPLVDEKDLLLCTDHPEEAVQFFYDEGKI